MSNPTITTHRPQKTVIGDGTTGRSRFQARLRRWRALIIILISILVIGAITILIRPAGNSIPLHPDNAEENGGMALATILQEQGVSVDVTSSVSEAAQRADSNTTVLAYDAHFVGSYIYDDVIDAGANLVLVDPDYSTLGHLTSGLKRAQHESGHDSRQLVPADCPDPHAQAAGSIQAGSSGFSRDSDSPADVCFVTDEVGPYASAAGGQIRLFAEAGPLTNKELATAGNAALTLRALGEKERVIWVIPSLTQAGVETEETSMMDFLPPWFDTVIVLGVAVTVFLALWRGRRMGRLVTEPLPVEVRAAETTIGLGRMYRRSNEIDHAARALRAGTALRCAQRLGVSPTASGTAVASAIAHAINRPFEEVAGLLLGPEPRTENQLINLAQMLDHLESEVHAS